MTIPTRRSPKHRNFSHGLLQILSLVDFAAMADTQNEHDEVLVFKGTENSIVAHAVPP